MFEPSRPRGRFHHDKNGRIAWGTRLGLNTTSKSDSIILTNVRFLALHRNSDCGLSLLEPLNISKAVNQFTTHATRLNYLMVRGVVEMC